MTIALWFLGGVAVYFICSAFVNWLLDRWFGPAGRDD